MPTLWDAGVYIPTLYTILLPLTTMYVDVFIFLLSNTCEAGWGDVGMVGKKIPLATWWLSVAKGIQVADTVRRGGMM